MIELVVAKDVLSEILYEDKSFKRALSDQVFSNKERSQLSASVAGLVGCELRHHFLLKKVLDKLGVELTLDERTYLYLALANNHFLKVLAVDKVNEKLKDVFAEKYQQISDILTTNQSLFDYVNINKKSFDYISIRFNMPKWLLKGFAKEIGLSKTYRIVHSLARPLDLTYRVNPYNEEAKHILEQNKDILKNEVYTDVVSVPRKAFAKNRSLKGDHLFKIDYHLKELVDTYQNQLIEEVSVYSDEDDSLVQELIARGKNKLGVNVVCPNYESRTKLVRSVRLQKAKNINVFKANDVVGMKTGISRKQEAFYCFPKSSSYTYINMYPDYIVRFRNTQIDQFVLNQQRALDNCAEFICDGGELIYIVNTLNHRETHDVVNRFLQTHPSFKLVKENQFVPEKNYGSFLYYAVLKLEANHVED